MTTSHRRFMVCGLGVLAWCWCGAGDTAAHEPSATSQSSSSDSVQHRSDIAWDAIEWTERRYKIEALGFKAGEETGNSWLGSDEVMIHTDDAKGCTVSGQIGGIDSVMLTTSTRQKAALCRYAPASSCVNDEYIETVVLEQCDSGTSCDTTYGPDYSFTYRITRMRALLPFC